MHTINILTLENGTLEPVAVLPLGPVIRVDPLTPRRMADVPTPLQGVFDLAVKCGEDVALVTCRRAGMPEQADGSHHQHFLVLQSTPVRTVGVTL